MGRCRRYAATLRHDEMRLPLNSATPPNSSQPAMRGDFNGHLSEQPQPQQTQQVIHNAEVRFAAPHSDRVSIALAAQPSPKAPSTVVSAAASSIARAEAPRVTLHASRTSCFARGLAVHGGHRNPVC